MHAKLARAVSIAALLVAGLIVDRMLTRSTRWGDRTGAECRPASLFGRRYRPRQVQGGSAVRKGARHQGASICAVGSPGLREQHAGRTIAVVRGCRDEQARVPGGDCEALNSATSRRIERGRSMRSSARASMPPGDSCTSSIAARSCAMSHSVARSANPSTVRRCIPPTARRSPWYHWRSLI